MKFNFSKFSARRKIRAWRPDATPREPGNPAHERTHRIHRRRPGHHRPADPPTAARADRPAARHLAGARAQGSGAPRRGHQCLRYRDPVPAGRGRARGGRLRAQSGGARDRRQLGASQRPRLGLRLSGNDGRAGGADRRRAARDQSRLLSDRRDRPAAALDRAGPAAGRLSGRDPCRVGLFGRRPGGRRRLRGRGRRGAGAARLRAGARAQAPARDPPACGPGAPAAVRAGLWRLPAGHRADHPAGAAAAAGRGGRGTGPPPRSGARLRKSRREHAAQACVFGHPHAILRVDPFVSSIDPEVCPSVSPPDSASRRAA